MHQPGNPVRSVRLVEMRRKKIRMGLVSLPWSPISSSHRMVKE
jgi:hypothetical protein